MKICNKPFPKVVIFIVLVTISTFMVSACSAMGQKSHSPCMDLKYPIAYPYSVERDGAFHQNYEIPPVWQKQLSTQQLEFFRQEQPQTEAWENSFYTQDIVVYQNQVWFGNGANIYRYMQNRNEVAIYNIPTFTSVGIDLLVTKDGSIWVAAQRRSIGSPLAKYNPNKDQFEIVEDQDGYLLFQHDDDFSATKIFEEANGNLLIILQGDLFIFSPSSHKAEMLLGRNKGITIFSLGISSDNKLWLTANSEKDGFVGIFRFDIENQQLEWVGPIPGFEGDSTNVPDYAITLDKHNRLWISNIAWLEADKEQNYDYWQGMTAYKIVDNPVFISEAPRIEYSLGVASGVYAFSDDYIWFSSTAGIVRLDTIKGEWCKLTKNVNVALAEDENGNIWFAFEQQLYKFVP